MAVKGILVEIGKGVSKNLPTILTFFTGAGVVTTTALGIGATPKALILLDEEVCRRYKSEDLYDLDIKKRVALLEKKEVVKITWKCYIPTAIAGILTIGCAVGAHKVNQGRLVALAGAYSLTEAAFKEYKKKVVETVGEKKAEKIKEEIHKDKILENPKEKSEITITGKGNTLCYEVLSGRYFMSDIEKIRQARNEINHEFIKEAFLTVNDVFYALGLSTTKLFDDLGWDLTGDLFEFNFSSQLTEDGTPCLVVDYWEEPIYNYRHY